MKTIALIFGSTDSEHDVSVLSAQSVFDNFPKDKFKMLPIYITKDGVWTSGQYTSESFTNQNFPKESEYYFKFDKNKKGLYDLKTQKQVDIDGAMLMLHGPVGEGGSIQGLLELANIPFVGSKLTSSAICMDKAFTHQICEKEGIKMAKYDLVLKGQDFDTSNKTYPLVVKPSREGSSFGISYVENEAELIKALDFAFEFDSRVLIEEYILAQELSVAVLKTKKEMIVSKPCQATRFKPIADYDEKYVSTEQETLFDLPYSQSVLDKVVEDSGFIFNLLECDHLSRIDFFITEDESVYFNEINTIPGFTKSSLYPMMMEKEGISYGDMLTRMFEDIV
ncbi:MAG: D-alanine--D-alanine ligase [Erysipelothrix sp.]|nr:D-alanine--D-alanine ligase [Erysipelothrix sp.]